MHNMIKAKIITICRHHKLNNYYVLIASNQDLAGMTITNYLLNSAEFASEGKRDAGESYRSQRHNNVQLYISSGSLLNLENLDDLYPHAGVFIFLSKLRSNSRIPTLTCHCTGNFAADNPYGGGPPEIEKTYPSLQKEK